MQLGAWEIPTLFPFLLDSIETFALREVIAWKRRFPFLLDSIETPSLAKIAEPDEPFPFLLDSIETR